MDISSPIDDRFSDDSFKNLSQENIRRHSFLRLSTKTTAPRRISLHQSVLTRNNLDDSFNQKVKNDSIEYDGSFTVYTSDRLHMKPSNDPFDGNNWSLHEMMEDSASTGIVLKSNEPWRQTAKKLYNEFLEIIQAHSNQTQVFISIKNNYLQYVYFNCLFICLLGF